MKLHNYFRSSASYRVRIALELKGLAYDYAAVHLTRDGGQQLSPAFTQTNPAQLVPVLEDAGERVTQSIAIIEYLDERHPEPPLLPPTPASRAHVRQLALAVACDIHPLGNLRVLDYLTRNLGATDAQRQQWAGHWIALGFTALETQLAASPHRGRYCFGDTPTMADCLLVPQMVNAVRFGVDLAPFPTLRAIDAACNQLGAFRRAHPSAQPDAE